MDWTHHVDQLLYDGETEQRRITFANATVVVTSHRVLVFTDGNGKAYRQVDRPNVRQVTVDHGGDIRHLVRALVPGVLGGSLLAIAALVDASGLVPESTIDADDGTSGGEEDATEGVGDGVTGVVDGLFGVVETLLATVELVALLLGAVLLALAVVFVGLYARSRSRRLILRVSGDDDVDVPVTDSDIEGGRVTTLKEAIRPGSPSGDLGDEDATSVRTRSQ